MVRSGSPPQAFLDAAQRLTHEVDVTLGAASQGYSSVAFNDFVIVFIYNNSRNLHFIPLVIRTPK